MKNHICLCLLCSASLPTLCLLACSSPVTPPPRASEYSSTQPIEVSGDGAAQPREGSSGEKVKPETIKTDPDSSADEAPTPPSRIMGSYLRCFIQEAMRRVELDDTSLPTGDNCRFESSGLVWTRDNGASYRQSDAVQMCNNFDDNYHDWRLPTLDEMQVAFTRPIDVLNSSAFLKLKTSFYWTQSPAKMDSILSEAGEYFSSFNLFTGKDQMSESQERLNVLCVRAKNQSDETDRDMF